MSSSNQLQSLSTRLDALTSNLKTTRQLVNRLAKLGFQPGSTPLESEEGDVRAELSSDIHESLKQQEEDLELLKQEVTDLTGQERPAQPKRESERDRVKSRLSVQVVRLGEDLKQYVLWSEQRFLVSLYSRFLTEHDHNSEKRSSPQNATPSSPNRKSARSSSVAFSSSLQIPTLTRTVDQHPHKLVASVEVEQRNQQKTKC